MSDLIISVLSYFPRKVRIEHMHVTDSVWDSLLRHATSHHEIGLSFVTMSSPRATSYPTSYSAHLLKKCSRADVLCAQVLTTKLTVFLRANQWAFHMIARSIQCNRHLQCTQLLNYVTLSSSSPNRLGLNSPTFPNEIGSPSVCTHPLDITKGTEQHSVRQSECVGKQIQ